MFKSIKASERLKCIKNKRAESYIDIIVGVIVITLLFVFIINTFSILFQKQDLDYISKELAKTAASVGYCGRDVNFQENPNADVDDMEGNALGRKLDELLKERSIPKNQIRITWSCEPGGWFIDDEDLADCIDPKTSIVDTARKASTNRKVQYGMRLTVTIDYAYQTSGVGSDIYNGKKTSTYSALSQVYWKY